MNKGPKCEAEREDLNKWNMGSLQDPTGLVP